MDNQQTERIKARIEARKAAEEVISFINSVSEGLDLHYWKVIREAVLLRLPSMGVGLVPMTDTEARMFSETPLPYGRYERLSIAEAPKKYLDWLAGTDDFKADLRRYLLNPGVRKEFQEALELED